MSFGDDSSQGLSEKARGVRRGPWIAAVFTGVAGFVDAVGYLALRHIYTANMSGNSVSTGVNMAGSQWMRTWERAFPVLLFVLGLTIAGIVMEAGRQCKVRRIFSIALYLEATCLGAFLISAWVLHAIGTTYQEPTDWAFYLLVGLAALAMGLQNASLTKMGALTVHTTHVTGALTRFAEEVVAICFWWFRRTRGRLRARAFKALRVALRQPAVRQAAGLAGLWVGYVVGAAIGAVAWQAWGLTAVAVPLAIVLLLAVSDRGQVG